MSKTCQRCGYQNDNKHFFCQQCGEALDDNVRLIMKYEKMKKAPSQSTQTVSKQDQNDDFVPIKKPQKKKTYVALWIVLCLVVVGGIAAYFLLPH